MKVSAGDRVILRGLGARVGEIARRPEMEERRRAWRRLNALDAARPMVMFEMSGVMDELVPAAELSCAGEWARGVERGLRARIFQADRVADDTVVEPRMRCGYHVRAGGYGLESVKVRGDNGRGTGSCRWDPPITDIAEGLAKLRFREFSVDRESSDREFGALEDVFAGILPVVRRGWYFWSQGLTGRAIDLVGLEGLMMAMYDQPDALRGLMAFLRDDHTACLDWFEREGLLFPNNEDDYIGSGGGGYTDLLPPDGPPPGGRWTTGAMWGLSESQETVGVSPEMFAEFVFAYQRPVIERFGFACYGCCEPLEGRWETVRTLPNLRRVSVAPRADRERMAGLLGRGYVYSRKPDPSLISTPAWNEGLVREDIRRTLAAAGGLNLEIVMKDVHTVAGDARRPGRWTEMVREEIAAAGLG